MNGSTEDICVNAETRFAPEADEIAKELLNNAILLAPVGTRGFSPGGQYTQSSCEHEDENKAWAIVAGHGFLSGSWLLSGRHGSLGRASTNHIVAEE